MRLLSLLSASALLLAVAACGTDNSSDPGEPEIRSEEDVQDLFDTIMPDLVAAFSQLAGSQPLAFVEPAVKQDGNSSVPCPQGGALNVDTSTGQASLVGCTVRGVIINGDLSLFIQPLDSMYQASFLGPLVITGTFNGVVEVIDSLVEWSDPPTLQNTFWSVTVYVELLNRSFTVMSGSSSGEPNERCEAACVAIDAACGTREDDCASDCTGDLDDCPAEMGLLLECVASNPIQCDPEQDQGLARDPCATEHTMVENCGKDPF